MIAWKKGNLLDDDANLLLNTVNCVGVMGKGIALQFKTKYPAMYQRYRNDCAGRRYVPGCIVYDRLGDGKVVANVATKDDWKNPSKMEWIDKILSTLAEKMNNAPSNYTVALPPLGCGNGGLSWKDVKVLVIKYLTDSPVEFRVYEP